MIKKYPVILSLKTNPGIKALCGLLIATSATAQPFEDIIERSFSIGPGGTIELHTSDADVELKGSDQEDVSVTVIRKAKRVSEERAQALFENHVVEFDLSGDRLTIEDRRENRNTRFWNMKNESFQVRYILTCPLQQNLEIKTNDGDLTIENIEGELEVRTNDGDLEVANLSGEIFLSTNDGDANAEDLAGEVVIKTNDGDLYVDRIEGSVSLNTNDGDIRLEDMAGSVKARTHDGDISVNLLSQPEDDCSIQTSDGDIDIVLPENIEVDLEVHTTDGHVRLDVRMDSSKTSGDSFHGYSSLNGGGPKFWIKSHDGNLTLRLEEEI